jgi:two-component system, OmpR family, response regulator MtrA
MAHTFPDITILIIEDDEATREFLELLLSSSGYQVRSAASGQEGLAQASAEPVSAVLLDRRLPDMDGVTVCRNLRERIGLNVPVIMLTADYDPTLEAAGRAAGATAVFRKPFRPDMLLNQLAAVLCA